MCIYEKETRTRRKTVGDASYRGDNWDKEEREGGACSSADAAYGLYSNER